MKQRGSKMRVLLITALVAGAFAAHPEIMSWEEWKGTFEKSYKTKEHHDAKRLTYNRNLAFIRSHNLRADQGKETYRLGVNQFTDMNKKEFKDTMLGQHQHFEKDYADLSDVSPLASVDWRTKGAVTPVKNQGQCGSCWSFSTTGSIEGAVAIASGKLTSLSEQQLMDCSEAYGDHSCEGGLMDNAFKYVKANGGLDSEADYPYKMRDESCNKNKESQHVSAISGYKDVQPNESAMVAAVSQGPVSIAIEADQSSFQHYRSGTFTGPCGTRLDHGVLTVGYTDDYFIVKNSWGETWGDNGYIMMGRSAGGSQGMCGMYLSASFPLAGTPGPSPPTPK